MAGRAPKAGREVPGDQVYPEQTLRLPIDKYLRQNHQIAEESEHLSWPTHPGRRSHPQRATAIFGHVFVGFLSLYLYCLILNRIKQAAMTAHLSPQGLLLTLSKIYAVSVGEERRITEVPKQVRKIVEKLKLDIFPNM